MFEVLDVLSQIETLRSVLDSSGGKRISRLNVGLSTRYLSRNDSGQAYFTVKMPVRKEGGSVEG